MKSISEIISLLRSLNESQTTEGALRDLSVRTQFVPPTLHIDVISEAFDGLDT